MVTVYPWRVIITQTESWWVGPGPVKVTGQSSLFPVGPVLPTLFLLCFGKPIPGESGLAPPPRRVGM